MTLAEEIENLKRLPGLHPDTITLLNQAAAAAAKPKTTTTMNIAEEIHAAALENLNGNGSRAIVKILNVLRRIPPHVFVTRAEEAQAAAEINQIAALRIEVEKLNDIAHTVIKERDTAEKERAALIIENAELRKKTEPADATAVNADEPPPGKPADFCPATQWKEPHHYFSDSSGKSWCASCRQPETARLTWTIDPENPARFRGYLKDTRICLFLIDRQPWGSFSMGGGVIPDGDDWAGPNADKDLDELQSRAETYLTEFRAALNR